MIIYWQSLWDPGGWFNIKMSSYQYRKSHCGDKTIWRSSDRLISTMGFPILVRWHLYIESGPWTCSIFSPILTIHTLHHVHSSHCRDVFFFSLICANTTYTENILVNLDWNQCIMLIDLRSAQVYCVAIFLVSQEVSLNVHRCCEKKLWVGWVGRGYTEISRYFPASWINWVTLVTKIKLLYSLRF